MKLKNNAEKMLCNHCLVKLGILNAQTAFIASNKNITATNLMIVRMDLMSIIAVSLKKYRLKYLIKLLTNYLADNSKTNFFDKMFAKRPDEDRETRKTNCSLNSIPEKCTCSKKSIFCVNQTLNTMPKNMPRDIREL